MVVTARVAVLSVGVALALTEPIIAYAQGSATPDQTGPNAPTPGPADAAEGDAGAPPTGPPETVGDGPEDDGALGTPSEEGDDDPLPAGDGYDEPAASGAADGAATIRVPTPIAAPPPTSVAPPPVNVEYLQYGVAIAVDLMLEPGPTCPDGAQVPCILGSGGGLAIRGGYRSPGPWYIGGSYEFIKMNAGNLYRLPIFQMLRAEMRYHVDLGTRLAPYASWGLGGVAYGNEWGAETAGAVAMGGAGIAFEVSRLALVGLNLSYRPVFLAGWTDTADQQRDPGIAHFAGLELQLELRSELGRR